MKYLIWLIEVYITLNLLVGAGYLCLYMAVFMGVLPR
jgi:hypothetical protein